MTLYVKFHDPWGSGSCCGPANAGPDTPITKGALDHIEAGIYQAAVDATQALTNAATAQTTANNAVPQTNIANMVYLNDGAGDPASTIVLSITDSPFTIPLRDSNGQFEVGNPTTSLQVVNLQTARGIANNYNFVLARQPQDIWQGAITRDANGAAVAANLTWPDGTPGVYTGFPSVSFPSACDGWTMTYGVPTQITYTQPTMTRDANGLITVQPMITAV